MANTEDWNTRLTISGAAALPRISASLDHPYQGAGGGGYLCRYAGKLTEFVMTGERQSNGFPGRCEHCGAKFTSLSEALADVRVRRTKLKGAGR